MRSGCRCPTAEAVDRDESRDIAGSAQLGRVVAGRHGRDAVLAGAVGGAGGDDRAGLGVQPGPQIDRHAREAAAGERAGDGAGDDPIAGVGISNLQNRFQYDRFVLNNVHTVVVRRNEPGALISTE